MWHGRMFQVHAYNVLPYIEMELDTFMRYVSYNVIVRREGNACVTLTDYFASANMSVDRRCHDNPVAVHSSVSTAEKSISKFTVTLGLLLTPNLYFTGAFLFASSKRFRRSLFPAGDLSLRLPALLKDS